MTSNDFKMGICSERQCLFIKFIISRTHINREKAKQILVQDDEKVFHNIYYFMVSQCANIQLQYNTIK